MITIEKVISWTIPLFGNKRIFAYGKLLVSDGKNKAACNDERGLLWIIYHIQ